MEITFDTLQNLSAHLRRWHTYRWGYVRFWRSDAQDPHIPVRAGGFNGVFPVKVLGMPERWDPEDWENFLKQLEVDAYCSINTLYGARFAAKEESYTRLNAAYVDLDYGHEGGGLSDEEAVAAIDELVDKGSLPTISSIEFSGRGLRVYWELGETTGEWEERVEWSRGLLKVGLATDPTRPQDLSPDEFRSMGPDSHQTSMEKISDFTRLRPHVHTSNDQLDFRGGKRLRRIQEVLGEIIATHRPELEPDNKKDIATSQRVVGSLNSKANKRVRYTQRVYEDGGTPTYALGELETFFGIKEEAQARSRSQRAAGQPRNEEMFERNRARYQQLWEEFHTIREGRRGFREGSRTYACLFAAAIMHGMGWPKERIREEVFDLAAGSTPPLDQDAAMVAYTSGVQFDNHPTNRTIALSIGVTVQEADRLGLKKLRPDFEYQRRPGTQRAQREETLAQLSELAEGGKLPYSIPELAEMMGRGKSTIRRYLRELGLASKGQRVSNVQVREDTNT